MQTVVHTFAVALSVCVNGLARAAGEGTVSRRVVDYLARPVEGAEVALYEEVHDFSTDRDFVRLRAEVVRTDGQGSFRFDSFGAEVSSSFWVETPGWTLAYTFAVHSAGGCGFKAGRTDVRPILPAEAVVRGRVVDAVGGEPVAQARLIIQADTTDCHPATSYLPGSTVTAKDGGFAFMGIPWGRHYLDVCAPHETGLVDRRVRFEVPPRGEAQEVTAGLHRGGVIEVEARDKQTNEPIADLPVYFWEAVQDEEASFHKGARTGADGALRIQAGTSGVSEEDGVLWAEGGDRDVRAVIGQNARHAGYASLIGRPSPIEDLGPDALPGDAEGRMVLLCFFDWQQRPSRNTVVELAERAEQLSQQNVALVGIQIGRTDRAELGKWIEEKHIAFPVHATEADEQTLRLTWGIRSLPWLILADRAHVVVTEGLRLAQIEEEIEKINERER